MIYVLLADGFEEIEALTPVDILRRGKETVRTVAIANNPVIGSHGIPVTADLTAEEALASREPLDLLILPGGMPGATHLDESPVTDALIARVQEDGGRLAAICAAPLVLGHRDLLVGKRATCYPGFEKDLYGATPVPGARVVTDGNVTTAVGMGAAGEFGLALLTLRGKEKEARAIAAGAFLS